MEAEGSSLNPEDVLTKNKKEKNEEHEKRRKDARSRYMILTVLPKLFNFRFFLVYLKGNINVPIETSRIIVPRTIVVHVPV